MSLTANCGSAGVVVVVVSCLTEPVPVLPLVDPPEEVDDEDVSPPSDIGVLPLPLELELDGSGVLGAGVYGAGSCVAGGSASVGVVAGGACATVVGGGGGFLSSCSSV